MARVLILGSGTQGLAILNSLCQCGHYCVLFSQEKHNYAEDSQRVEHLYSQECLDEEEQLQVITKILQEESIDAIIPMGDASTEFLCKYQDTLLQYAKFKLPSYDNFMRGYDKNQLMQLCQEKGYPHPRTIDLSKMDIESEEVRNFDYPGMLKPNCTTGGRGMIEVQSYHELSEKYPSLHAEYGEYHLQKFIKAGGKQEKIQLYIDENKKLVAHSVQQKLRWYPIKGGSNCCAVSIEDDKMVNICYQILKDIDWLGFADFDLIENPDTSEMLIMEINPRVPACIKGSIEAGINWGEVIVNGYLDLPQKQYQYKTGVYLRHLGLDFLWFLKSSNRWKAKPCWFHIFGRKIHYQDMSSWTDPLPFIMGTYHNIKKIFDPNFKKAKQL